MEDVTGLASPPPGLSHGLQRLPLLCDISERRAAGTGAGASRAPAEAAILLSVAEGHLCDVRPGEAEGAAAEALAQLRRLGEQDLAADALLLLLAAQWLGGEPGRALQAAREELQAFRAAGARRGEAAMMLAVAELLSGARCGRPARDEALQSGAGARELFRALEDARMEAAASLVLATAHGLHGRADDALRAATDAAALFGAAGSRRGEAKALSTVAASHFLARRYAEALRFSQMAREAWQETGMLRLEAAEVRAMAQCHHALNDHRQMLQFAEESLALCQQAKCNREEAATLKIVVLANVRNGNEDQALFLAQQAVLRFQAAGYARGQVAAQEALVYFHRATHDVQKSLAKADDALELIRELGDTRWEANMLMEVAEMQLDSGNHREALRAAEGALLDLEELEDTRWQGLVRLRLLVRAHAANMDFDAALLAATEAAGLFRELGERQAEGVAKFVEGSVQLWGSEFDEAQRSVAEAQQIFQELGDMKLVVHALDLLSQVALARNRAEEAARLAHDAHVLCQLEGDKFMEAAILLLVARAHFAILSKHTGDWGDAGPPYEFTSSLTKAAKAATVARRIAEKMRYGEVEASAACILAQAKLVSGHLDEALKEADEAVRLYRSLQDELGEGHALAAKAQVLSALGKTAEATEALQAAMAVAQACGDEELKALARQLLEGAHGRAERAAVARPEERPGAEAEPEERPEASPTASAVQEQAKGLEPALVEDLLHGIVLQVMGEPMENDTPFMDAGVDSLMSIELRSQVNKAFVGLNLSSTLTFDFPTIREVTGHIVEKSKD